MYTDDLEVLESILRLLIRPAQRLGSARSSKSEWSINFEHLISFARPFGTKEQGYPYKAMMQPSWTPPSSAKALHFQFYRTTTATKKLAQMATPDATSPSSPTVVPNEDVVMEGDRTPGPTSKKRRSFSEGLVTVDVPDLSILKKKDAQIAQDLITEYAIPAEHHLPLFHAIRSHRHLNDVHWRRQLINCKVYAVAILGMPLLFFFCCRLG